MKHVHVPTELSFGEILANQVCLSPGRYVRFIPPTSGSSSQFASLEKLVILRNSKVKVRRDGWYEYAEIGDIDVDTGGIRFHKMRGFQLPERRVSMAAQGDVLISTVRTYRKGIGYVSSDSNNLVTTNAVLDVCGVTDYLPGLTLLYLYSFLRTEFFVEQVWSMLHRGVYPRMDKGTLDKILIPITSDSKAIHYVSVLTQAIIDKEKEIQAKDEWIEKQIELELDAGQGAAEPFRYTFPGISEVHDLSRLDASMYSEEFKHKQHQVRNYKHGSASYAELGFTIGRGQNLQVSCIGESIYSDVEKRNFYRLMLPTHISDTGVVSRYEWLGNKRRLDTLHEGDIVFGGEATFRCAVVCDALTHPTITNIHGIVLRRDTMPTYKKVFAGAWLRYLGRWGYSQAIAVGGQGGSLAQRYFGHILFPKFPDDKQAEIARLYHNDAPSPGGTPRLDTFIDWHRQWNKDLGIWELDREMKALECTLVDIQEQIIQGKSVNLPT